MQTDKDEIMKESTFAPKVSIVIPVYNGSNYLRNAIDCALAQTYPDIEVLVINDGSSDEGATEKIALSYGDKIRYYSKPNGGVSSALNYGIRKMTGDYFSWLSHDDAYSPTKIEDAVELLKTTKNDAGRTIAYTFGYYINKDGNNLKSFPHRFVTGRRYSGEEMAEYSVRNGTLNGCCMLIPKAAFAEFGGFNESLRYSQDTLMWLTLFFGGYGLISDTKDNVMMRLHGGQVSRNRQDLFVRDSMAIAQKLAPDMAKHSDGSKNLLYLYALRAAQYDCGEVARYYQDFASRHCPFTVGQRLNLAMRLLYGRFRGRLKSVYYRYILKVGT